MTKSGGHVLTSKWNKPLNVLIVPHAILDSSKKVIMIRKFPPDQHGFGKNVVRIPDDVPVKVGWTWTGRMFIPPQGEEP